MRRTFIIAPYSVIQSRGHKMCRLIPGGMCPHASYLKESRLTLFKLSQSLRWCHFFTSLQLCVKAYNFLEITLYIFYYGRRFCKCIKSINIQTALLSVTRRHLSGLLRIHDSWTTYIAPASIQYT